MSIRIAVILFMIAISPGANRVTAQGPSQDNAPTITDVESPQLSRLEVELSQTSCFEREPLLLTVRWSISSQLQDVRAVDMRVPILADNRFTVYVRNFEPEANTNASTSTTPIRNQQLQKSVGVPVRGLRAIAEKSSYEKTDENGYGGSTLTMQFVVVPNQAGEITFDAPSATFAARDVTDGRDGVLVSHSFPPWFNNNFFDVELEKDHKLLRVNGDPIKLTVKPLPSPVPANFTGMFRPFDFQQTVDPMRVTVGDPVRMSVTTGDLAFPECFHVASSAWQRDPDRIVIADDSSPPSISGKKATVQRIASIISDQVTQIPGMKLSHFDTEAQRFVTRTCQPVPLIVTQETVGNDIWSIVSQAGMKNMLVASDSGIAPKFSPSEVLHSSTLSRRNVHRYLLPLVFALLVPVFYYTATRFITYYRFRNTNPQSIARLYAYRRFRCGLGSITKSDDPHHKLYHLLRDYFALVSRIRPGALTLSDMLACLPQESTESSILTDLYEELRHPIYSQQINKNGISSLVSRSHRIVEEVERLNPCGDCPTKEKWAIRSTGLLVATLLTLLGTVQLFILATNIYVTRHDRSEQREIAMVEAERIFQNAAELYNKSPEQSRAEFAKAAAFYEATARELRYPANAWFNAATAWFLSGNMGKSICLYQEAEHAGCDARLTRQGLTASRHLAIDSFDVSQNRLYQSWLKIRTWLNSTAVATSFCICYTLGFTLLLLQRFILVRRRWVVICFTFATIFMLITLASCCGPRHAPRGAVVTSQTVPRQGDGHFYEPLYRTPLHCGAEFTVTGQSPALDDSAGHDDRENVSRWIHVRFPDGQEGWVESDAVLLINSQ